MRTQYGPPGRFVRAVDAAIARRIGQPYPPVLTLCDGDGTGPCALPTGHVERAGSPHIPAPWRVKS